MKELKITAWILLVGLAVIFGASFVAFGQAPQTQTAPPFAASANYVRGWSPSYSYDQTSSGLTFKMQGGTNFACGSLVNYAGGSITLAASSTNYVYLDTTASCAPAVSTTVFALGTQVPLYVVVTGSSTVTTISDVKTMFQKPSTSSGGLTSFNGRTTAAATLLVSDVNALGTISNPTTGNAQTATALAATPSQCGGGEAAGGIAANGNAQGCFTPSGGGGAGSIQTYNLANNSSGGTTLNLLACWDGVTAGSHLINTCPSSTAFGGQGTDTPQSYVGVVVAGAGTSGFATVAFDGIVQWICDGTVPVGMMVRPSFSVAGECEATNNDDDISNPSTPSTTTILGRVLVSNTGSGTAATIQLAPFFTFTPVDSALSLNGAFLMMSDGNGSSFLSQSQKWQQAPSNYTSNGRSLPFALVGTGLALDGPNVVQQFLFGGLGEGSSGDDLSIATGAGFAENISMVRIDSAYYSPLTTYGGTSNEFDPGSAPVVIKVPLTGNTTNTIRADDNAGDILYFDVVQSSSGGPFTFTWPSNFVNAPTVTSTPGASTLASFLFDGTNYQCVAGCASSGGSTPIDVNGSSVSNPNFNGATPAATTGGINTIYQVSGSNVSSMVPAATTSTPGVIKPDGITCTTALGVLTCTGSSGSTSIAICADTSGSSTAQSCTTSPSFTPVAGSVIAYTTSTPNSGVSLTENVNGSGAKPVAKWQKTTTLAAGDVQANSFILETYDGTNWELSTIGNAPSGSGGITPETVVASNSSDIELTTCISSAHLDYQIRLSSIILATPNQDLQIQFSTNGGSTWDTSANYDWTNIQGVLGSGGAAGNEGLAGGNGIQITGGGGGQAGTPFPVNATLTLHDPLNAASFKFLDGTGNRVNTGPTFVSLAIGGIYTSNTAVNAFRIIATSGNITSGQVVCQPLAQ
jgi:hypothetical protein